MITVVMPFEISKAYQEWKSVFDGARRFSDDSGMGWAPLINSK